MKIFLIIIGVQLIGIIILFYLLIKSRKTINFFISTLDSIPVGICTINNDLEVFYGNKALFEYYQIPTDTKSKIRYKDVLNEDLIKLIETELKRNYKSSCYFEGCAAPGNYLPQPEYVEGYHWFRCHYIPILDENEAIKYYVVYNENRTDEKEAEFKLRKQKGIVEGQLKKIEALNDELHIANKDLESFAAMVSHDLKAPLRTISGFSKILNERYKGKIETKDLKLLEFMYKAGNQMTKLIDDVLLFSQVKKQSELKMTDIEIESVLQKIIKDNEIYLKEKKAKITFRDLPVIHGNESLLYQLFQNLVLNGVKYSKEDVPPIIRIYSIETDEAMTISVEDNGIGIPAKELSRVLEPFVKLHSEDQYGGSGLGLSTCSRIVKFLGGELSIESEENIGTIIKIIFPSGKTLPDKSNSSDHTP